MAFSALSMSYKDGIPNLDALQHYQRALPSLKACLRSEEDLTSDGVFLTHFILLLYEIAAGEERGLSLWSQHIDQLLRICLLRRKLYGHEPYPFIIWWVASIDTHVVLSGMGNGEFVETMLRNNMLPSGMDPQYPYDTIRRNSPSRGLSNEHEALPSALAFHRRPNVLAAELGLLARDLRVEESRNPHDRSQAMVRRRQERIGALQDTLRRTWNVQMPASVASGYCNQVMPVGARGIFEHVSCQSRGSKSGTVVLPPIRLLNVEQRTTVVKRRLLLHCTTFYCKVSANTPPVLRPLPRLPNLLPHLHVQHPTPPLPFLPNPRSIPMRGRNPPPSSRNRL